MLASVSPNEFRTEQPQVIFAHSLSVVKCICVLNKKKKKKKAKKRWLLRCGTCKCFRPTGRHTQLLTTTNLSPNIRVTIVPTEPKCFGMHQVRLLVFDNYQKYTLPLIVSP